MKISILVFALLSSQFTCWGQEVVQPLSKMDKFTSKSGVIIKLEDYKLPNIDLVYGSLAEARIRKIDSGGDVKLFYQISNEGKYGTKTASVAIEDLIELTKALESLKSQLGVDEKSEADYLENRFVTEDGLHLGYLLDKKKVTWYVRLEKYGSGSSIFLRNVETISQSLALAKQKMDTLK